MKKKKINIKIFFFNFILKKHLNDNKLTGSIPPELGKLSNLEYM